MTDSEDLDAILERSGEQIDIGGELLADLAWEFIRFLIRSDLIESDDDDFVRYVLHGREGTLSFHTDTHSFQYQNLAKWLVDHRLPYDYHFIVPLDTWQVYRPEIGYPVNVQVNPAGRPVLEWSSVKDAITQADGDFDTLVRLLRLQLGKDISPLPCFRIVGKVPPMPKDLFIPWYFGPRQA